MRVAAQLSGFVIVAASCLVAAGPALAMPVGALAARSAQSGLALKVNVTPGDELRWRPKANLPETWARKPDASAPGSFEAAVERARIFRDAASQLRVGLAFYNGEGVAQDFAEAAKWFRMAAQQGNTTAQAVLGFQYYAGAGVGRDLAEAHLWVSLALRSLPSGQGRRSVEAVREAIRDELSDDQRAAADRRIRDWLSGAPLVFDQ